MLTTFSKIWNFAKDRHPSMVKGLVFSFLRSLFGLTQLFALILTIHMLTGDMEFQSGIIRILVLTLVCVAGNYVTSYMEQINTMSTGFFMVGDKRVALGNMLRKVPLGFFNDSSTGKITATLTTTLFGVEMGAPTFLVVVISGLFNGFSFLVFMLFYDWRIGLLTGVGIAAYLLVTAWQMKVSQKHAPALQKAQTHLAESALTFLQGIKVTKAFGHQEGDRQLKEAIQGSCDGNINLTNVTMPSQFAAHLTTGIFESLLLFLSLYLYFTTDHMPLVKVILLMIFSFMAFASLNQAGSMLSMIGMIDSGISQVEKLEETEQLHVKEPVQTATSNEIVFDHVSFSYGDHQVLQDISTRIQPHSFTAVIGPSGSGKTTLCQLIPRFRDVDQGSITIGGADIRHLLQEELMQKISMVFQKVYLFEDTILNNIRFGKPEATLEEVRKAAKAARCDAFIMALPKGYETMVEEGGSNLSGGEKQRISIARAILKDSPIIILDEATSALDAENEHEILAAIDELIRDKTVIMIAHRIPSVQKADHIIAIQQGRIVQEGTHQELIAREGLYKDFVSTCSLASGWKLAN